MSIEIYWISGSPNSWRVLLAAELLRLPYESKLIELSKGQNRTLEYLALNPRGKVPVLRDGDFVLYESLAILEHLDRSSAGSLYGTSRREAGITHRIISEFECYVRDPLSKVTSHLFVAGGAPPNPRTPTLEVAMAALETLRPELAWIADLVKQGALAGDRLTAADIAIYPFVRLLLRAASKAEARALELAVFPAGDALGRWIARIEAIPGFERTYPPHWR